VTLTLTLNSNLTLTLTLTLTPTLTLTRRRASTGGEEQAMEGGKASRSPDWRPPAMLWLVQRDFLQEP